MAGGYLGVSDIVSAPMRTLAFATQGAITGAATAAISGGDIGQGILGGAIVGGAMGFMSSEQFQNWRGGSGFKSNQSVAEANFQRAARVEQWANQVGSGTSGDYELGVLNNGGHAALTMRDGGGQGNTWGKYPLASQDKGPGLGRNLAYILGKKVDGVLLPENTATLRLTSVYKISTTQAVLFQSYVNNGASSFALTTNCTDWAMGGLRSAGIYVPKSSYSTLGFSDPGKLPR